MLSAKDILQFKMLVSNLWIVFLFKALLLSYDKMKTFLRLSAFIGSSRFSVCYMFNIQQKCDAWKLGSLKFENWNNRKFLLLFFVGNHEFDVTPKSSYLSHLLVVAWIGNLELVESVIFSGTFNALIESQSHPTLSNLVICFT